MQVDYIIIGQGLCGTLLSSALLHEGATVLVVDEAQPHSSSKVASGLINPVTGKRVVKTWLIEELLPVAIETYTALEKALGMPVISPTTILDFYATLQERETFLARIEEGSEYLNASVLEGELEPYFRFNYGVGAISSSLLIDMHNLLSAWRKKLQQDNTLLEEKFDWGQCTVEQYSIAYKGITAKKIICCEGTAGFDNAYFSALPYSKNKGEVIIASIPGLPRTAIYKQKLKIVPWGNSSGGLFWIGSSFDWKYDDVQPTAAFRKQVKEQLGYWLKLPYTIVDHFAAERPAAVEYKPFVGLHPAYPSVGILNGMGAKGCSLAPYFARQFAQHLVHCEPLMADVDINRFARALKR